MREPDERTVIRFNTSHRGDGYTYVAFRIPGSKSGGESWCSECHAHDYWGALEDRFPFNGIVTWPQIVKFACDRPIEIATQWKTHPDWQRPSWYDRYFE
jgi:hypothetical protein